VAREVGPIVTDSNVLVLGATHGFDETPRPDVVLVPGSSCSTATQMVDRQLLDWLRKVHLTTRLTVSVCSGALVLAAAGLLEGRPATSHWAALPLLGQYGVEARPSERIVRSGKLWTAAGVSAGIDLAFSMLAELDGEETARVVQLMIEYDPQPPFDSGHMSKASEPVRQRARRETMRASISARELVSLPRALLARWRHVLWTNVRGERRVPSDAA
jgi:transcriptional regulator GlxA family with amidase domain